MSISNLIVTSFICIFCRGYYVRAKAITTVVTSFVEQHQFITQILSLGAGFDTTYFRLHNEGRLSSCKYFEVRFNAYFEWFNAYFELFNAYFEWSIVKIEVITSYPTGNLYVVYRPTDCFASVFMFFPLVKQ